MAVSKRLRYEILRRDNHACRYCGLAAPEVKLTVDHVVPTALGGSDDPSNLVAACKDCNAGKSASSPDSALVADVNQDAVRWALAMNTAGEQRAAELAAERKRLQRFDRKWRVEKFRGREFPRDGNWKSTVLRFMASGLDDQFLADAIATAMGNKKLPVDDTWRYFCGICWRELDKVRELAEVQVKMSAPASTELPYGPGFDPAFDVLNLADTYITELLEHMGAPDGVLKFAIRAYWDGMQDAYKAFLQGPGELWDSADDRASEEFSNATAWYMAEIRRLCQGQVSNGAE